MESTTCLLTEWALKASRHLKADSVFLIKKGACAVVEEDIALHLKREFRHVPKSVSYAFVDVWKQWNPRGGDIMQGSPCWRSLFLRVVLTFSVY